ncbi:MAG: hypothetical protein WA985_10155, partial [Erythrobacter sp.]
MELTIYDVEHGACALIRSRDTGRLALIDCGHNGYTGWNPADHIRSRYGRDTLDYLAITNTDQDHYSNLSKFLQVIHPQVLLSNPLVPAEKFAEMKRWNGPLSGDAQAYFQMRKSYTAPVRVGFDSGMGGVKEFSYFNSPDDFDDFNNLSLAIFISYRDFMILFPGDLERPGWLKLLEDESFRSLLRRTTVLVAPHHGRINQNYCEEIFDFLSPELVVISDKPIVHETQVKSASEYRKHVREPGIFSRATGDYRKVLTTRRD